MCQTAAYCDHCLWSLTREIVQQRHMFLKIQPTSICRIELTSDNSSPTLSGGVVWFELSILKNLYINSLFKF